MDRSDCSELPHLDPYKFDTLAGCLEDHYLEDLNENFTSLLLRRGKLFSSTGLRNIQYSVASLKRFSTTFTNDMNREETNNQQSTYIVELKPLVSDSQHPCPLKISVQQVREDEQKCTFVYVGVFYSWRMEDARPCREYLNLFFLFAGGVQKYMNIMHALFQKYFGCKISQIVYTQCEMKWLLAIITQYVLEGSSGVVQLTYQTNGDSLKLELSFSFNNLKKIWNTIHDKNDDIIKYEEVVRLFAALEEHVLESSRLDLSHYLLKRFSVPQYVTLDSEGKISIMKLRIFDLISRFIKDQRSY